MGEDSGEMGKVGNIMQGFTFQITTEYIKLMIIDYASVPQNFKILFFMRPEQEAFCILYLNHL